MSTPPSPRFDHSVWLSHPSHFLTPGTFKDGMGSSGGTAISRLAMKGGAHNTDPPEIQACYRSRFVGGTIVEGDLSQAELRAACLLSGEPNLLRAFTQGEDLHREQAIRLFGPDVVNEPGFNSKVPGLDKRQVGKTIWFWDLYLGGALKGQATVMGDAHMYLPIEFFENLVQTRSTRNPALYAWQQSLIDYIEDADLLVMPFTGQCRYFLNKRHQKSAKYPVNEIVNTPIQALSSNLLHRISHRLHWWFVSNPRVRLFLNRHDEIRADCASHEDADLFQQAYTAALHLECSEPGGYWYETEQLVGRSVPMECEFKRTPRRPPPSQEATPCLG